MREVESLLDSKDFSQLNAAMLMERQVVTCRPSDSGRYVAAFLAKFDFGSLPVLDEAGRLLGLVTEYDLLRALRAARDLREVTAGEVMTRELTTVQVNTPVEEIVRLFESEHLIRLPVLDGDRLAGILARRDVLFGYLRATARYWV
jgi:CBS domain-containing protein